MQRSIVSFFDLVSNAVNLITTCLYSIPMEILFIFIVYVGDLLIIGNNKYLIYRLKKQLVDSFDMTNLDTDYFLGLQVL
jgi:hypothetical protein